MASTAPAVGLGSKKVRARENLRRLGRKPPRAPRDGPRRTRRDAILPAGARSRTARRARLGRRLTSPRAPVPPLPRQRKPAASAGKPSDSVRVLQRESLRQLLSQIVPDERVDPLVEAFLLDVADDFVDSVVAFACKLAAHRKSDTLEVKDIVLHLERAWDMVLPGFETEELREFKPPPEARLHKKRMADVRRALASAAAAEAETVLAREKEREEEKEKGDPSEDAEPAEGARLDASKADADAS